MGAICAAEQVFVWLVDRLSAQIVLDKFKVEG